MIGFWTRRLAVTAFAAAAGLAAFASGAQAHGFVGISVGLPFFYPPSVYYAPPPPPPVYYAPAPVYYAAPVVAAPASPDFVAPDGRTCRHYRTTISVNGVAEEGYGTACLDPDGVWRVAP